MDFLVTFLEGVATFVSPCLLPMLPVYVAYFAGDAAEMPAEDRNTRTFVCAAGFVVGFSLLFCCLGAFAGTVGGVLFEYQGVLNAVCGSVVALLGLNYLGVLRIPLLERTLRPGSNVVPRGFFSSVAFGAAFAAGWTPCVGAFLGSALSLAASSASAGKGVALLLCYSLGLGLPFVISAVAIDQLEGAFGWVRKHYEVVNRACGAALVLVGVLMATGLLGTLLGMLA